MPDASRMSVSCKLFHWDDEAGDWAKRYKGSHIALIDPEGFVRRLADKDKIGRVEVFRVGSITEVERVVQTHCQHCREAHEGPYDGMCLI